MTERESQEKFLHTPQLNREVVPSKKSDAISFRESGWKPPRLRFAARRLADTPASRSPDRAEDRLLNSNQLSLDRPVNRAHPS
jgi:hypothetical protein